MFKDEIEYRKQHVLSIQRAFFCLLILTAVFLGACGKQSADLRSSVPGATLIYLETNDLGRALSSLSTGREVFGNDVSGGDFSALAGIQVAIAVTGFETTEKQVTDENSVLDFKPQFIAVADTHAWEWQTQNLAEETLGNFVNEVYGGEVELEISAKDGGDWFEWTAIDNRQVFAFVEGSRIFFSNDQASLEKALAVRRGESESLLKNESLGRALAAGGADERGANLAFGFVSEEGIGQIASLAGVSAAIEATEEDSGRSFIARVLPQVLQNTTKEFIWTSRNTGQGIEDKFLISLKPEVSGVLKQTMTARSENRTKELAVYVPAAISGLTRYNLKEPRVAWRSLLLITKESTDSLSGGILSQFSDSLLEPYGVAKAEEFLDSVDSEILTVKFDMDGDEGAAIALVRDEEKLRESLGGRFDFKANAEKKGSAGVWLSSDKQFAAAFAGKYLIIGSTESVNKCLEASESGENFVKNENFQAFSGVRAPAVSFGRETLESTEKLNGLLGIQVKEGLTGGVFLTETGFSDRGIERRTISGAGLIGTILGQVAGE